MNCISPKELKNKLDNNSDILVIDIREPYEYEICNIKGKLIPMAEIVERKNEIPTDRDVVIHCKTGKRAAAVIDTLTSKFGFSNLYNLDGGIVAFAEQIDDSLEIY